MKPCRVCKVAHLVTSACPTTSRVVKAAVVREEGYPEGFPAPCYIKCPCGARPPAYRGDFVCRCGVAYAENGWAR